MSMLTVRKLNNKEERGFSLLEYCAGAAVILAIAFVAFRSMGTEIQGMYKELGDFTKARATEVKAISESSKLK